jgi:hypothetical protein
MSAKEYNEWLAYFDIEPFGPQEDEYRTGLITSTVANTARDEEKRKEPFEAKDFMREGFIDDEGFYKDEEGFYKDEEYGSQLDPEPTVLMKKVERLFGPLPGDK